MTDQPAAPTSREVIRRAIQVWWNDAARKVWRESLEDPDERDVLLRGLARRIDEALFSGARDAQEAAERDYADMRRMQRQFIETDQVLRALREEVGRLPLHPDGDNVATWASGPQRMPLVAAARRTALRQEAER